MGFGLNVELIKRTVMAYNKQERNVIGTIGWFICALVINLLALAPMVWREKKQAKNGGFEVEWDDILLYGAAIFVGSGVQGVLLQYAFGL